MTTMRFFMIGSWTEGMLHFQKLIPFIVSYEAATIQASVYKLPIGFPVLVDIKNQTNNHTNYQTSCQTIHGQMIELKYDATLLALMDALHGVKSSEPTKGLHLREQVQVTKLNGETESVQVYFYNPKKLNSKAVLITDAQWKKVLQEEPPLPLQLTEKQKHYVLKLGAVKGRDIVPMSDLNLYRELIKLELVVDKGRRLALSSLGKEVYNYLV